MPTIYDLVTSNEIAAYWEMKNQDRAPYMGETLFPSAQKLGLDLKWLKGSSGLPILLKPSAFDVAAIPRPRIGFEKLSAQMPFFKESYYIDEELRQQLNMVLESGNDAYTTVIMERIFNDETNLLEGAAATREFMRMMALTTGTIVAEANGQIYEYDYQMPDDHKVTVTTSWSDPKATIIQDIKAGIDKIVDDTGVTISRALTTSKVIGNMRKNEEIRMSLAPLTSGSGYISDTRILSFLSEQLGVEIVVNDKKYRDFSGTVQNFVPADVFVMFPSGTLGNTWLGTTPEQSDLLSGSAANVSIVDTGVAITTMKKTDPVNVETKVTQICLPDFPTADQIYILDTVATTTP
uniref:Major capsid protein n=1 Tax=Dulem virus 36 TaxID=3145754 RepID=A0AAU8AZL3_9CAUD